MDLNDWALIGAGFIGVAVGIAHGIVVQRNIVSPIYQESTYPLRMRRIASILLQFSTYCWVLGGLGLIAAPKFLDASSTLTLGVIVIGFYAFGAVGNFWGTRGKHPGWALLAASTGLILFAIWP